MSTTDMTQHWTTYPPRSNTSSSRLSTRRTSPKASCQLTFYSYLFRAHVDIRNPTGDHERDIQVHPAFVAQRCHGTEHKGRANSAKDRPELCGSGQARARKTTTCREARRPYPAGADTPRLRPAQGAHLTRRRPRPTGLRLDKPQPCTGDERHPPSRHRRDLPNPFPATRRLVHHPGPHTEKYVSLSQFSSRAKGLRPMQSRREKGHRAGGGLFHQAT